MASIRYTEKNNNLKRKSDYRTRHLKDEPKFANLKVPKATKNNFICFCISSTQPSIWYLEKIDKYLLYKKNEKNSS